MARRTYTGPRYSLGQPGKPQYLLGGYARPAAPARRYTGPRFTLGQPGHPQYRLGGYAPAGAAAPAAAAVPGPAAIASPGAEPPSVDAPFGGDAQYFAERAQREFQASQQRDELDRQGAYDRTDFAEALRRMALKQPEDEQATREAANRQGLLFSGVLGKDLGTVRTGYERQRSDAQLDFDRREAARSAARAALEQGIPIENAVALAGAADRQLARDQEAATANALVPNPEPAPTAEGPAPVVAKKRAVTTTGYNRKRGQRYRIVSKGGKTYHYYAGGRPVRVS